MFRNIAAIGFICLSAGSFAAEKAPIQNTIENAKFNNALAALLNERASWGTSPSQSAADNGAAATKIALEHYLARRDSWGTGQEEVAAGSNDQALASYLARRDSWGSAPESSPKSIAANPHAEALSTYLARRDAWGAAPSDYAFKLNRLALRSYLARRDSWGTGPKAVAANPQAQALAEYMARRDSWGTKPAAKPNAIAATLARLFDERASWGTHPSITSAEANSGEPALTLAAYLERRARWNEAAATRVAAFTMSRPARSDASACTEALRQMTAPGGIKFAFNSAQLTSEGGNSLQQVAAAARNCTGFRIRIEGHTDSIGDAAMNQALSEKRAAAVADYLQAAGIEGVALQAIGFGESQPLVPNTTPANRALNRRIELTVLVD